MTAWYREINVIDEPRDIGVDSEDRLMMSFNITAVKRASALFVEEIVGILEAAGVGTQGGAGGDIFATSKSNIPEGDGPYLALIETGGVTPERTHNQISPPAYQRPGMQLVARAKNTLASRTMARAAYDALVGIRNVTVVG